MNSFEAGTEVTTAMLIEKGMAKKGMPVKILANGDISNGVTVNVDKVSGGAKTKIEAAGGKVVE